MLRGRFIATLETVVFKFVILIGPLLGAGLPQPLASLKVGMSLPLASPAITGTADAEAPDVHAVAEAVDQHYNRLHSLQAEFIEIYRGGGIERTESGTLWLKKPGMKKPGKMRWEYRSPRKKLFVSDGKDAWFYVPDDRQVRRTAAGKLNDIRSPLGFLLGKTKLERELRGLSLAPDVAALSSGDVVLRGVPQAWADRVSEVLLEITPEYKIARISIEELDGSVTEYRLQQQKENVQISDGQFEFETPMGVEIVEGGLEP